MSNKIDLKQSCSESGDYNGATVDVETSANLNKLTIYETSNESRSQSEFKQINTIRSKYQRIRKICDTQQGELFEALCLQSNKTVIIKKVSQLFHSKRIAKHEDDGMTYFTPKNIIKEAMILGHLTAANQFTFNYITQLVDFFHCDDYFYLVLEHSDDNAMSLKQFVQQSHRYIRAGKLNVKKYARIIRFIFWQLFALTQWMHNDMSCCHLDFKLEHVILKNVEFVMDNEQNMVRIKPNISIMLCDFGSAELFKNGDFKCDKTASPFAEIQYQSPLLLNGQTYDAQKADVFALGAMLFHCLVGGPLYSNLFDAGYASLKRDAIADYVKAAHLRKYINKNTLDLVKNMLNVNENERFKIMDVIKHESMEIYFKKYKNKMKEKSKSQRLELTKQRELKYFPYY